MLGSSMLRRKLCRRKRALLAAALCSASFVTGHYLFGQEGAPSPAPPKPSLLSQYLEAKNELVPAAAEKLIPIHRIKITNAAPATEEKQTTQEKPSEPIPVLRIQPAETPVKPPVGPAIQPSAIREALEGRSTLIRKAPSLTQAENESATPENLPENQSPASSLRSAAVSAANDLPFIPAQPLSEATEVKPALAEVTPTQQAFVAQASMAVAAPATPLQPPPVTATPATPTAGALQNADDENLPPIVPAWAVPRPGTKKRVQPVQPTLVPQPRAQVMQSPPVMKIELGAPSTRSPAVLPPPSNPVYPKTSQSTKTSYQRLPPAEPSLLPPFASAPQPIALEIRNPHVAQANFEAPVPAPQPMPRHHLDDGEGGRK